MLFFIEAEKQSNKFIWKHDVPEIVKTTLNKIRKVEVIKHSIS